MASNIDETSNKADPAELVRELALSKASEIAAKISKNKMSRRTLVLGADTVVVLASQVLGKPSSEEEAFQMLMMLSDRVHHVYTGVSIVELPGNVSKCIHQVTAVHFRALLQEEARAYAKSGEPMDKAGAYAVQGAASAFINAIEGCYSNVIGLPVSDTVQLLRAYGMKVLGA